MLLYLCIKSPNRKKFIVWELNSNGTSALRDQLYPMSKLGPILSPADHQYFFPGNSGGYCDDLRNLPTQARFCETLQEEIKVFALRITDFAVRWKTPLTAEQKALVDSLFPDTPECQQVRSFAPALKPEKETDYTADFSAVPAKYLVKQNGGRVEESDLETFDQDIPGRWIPGHFQTASKYFSLVTNKWKALEQISTMGYPGVWAAATKGEKIFKLGFGKDFKKDGNSIEEVFKLPEHIIDLCLSLEDPPSVSVVRHLYRKYGELVPEMLQTLCTLYAIPSQYLQPFLELPEINRDNVLETVKLFEQTKALLPDGHKIDARGLADYIEMEKEIYEAAGKEYSFEPSRVISQPYWLLDEAHDVLKRSVYYAERSVTKGRYMVRTPQSSVELALDVLKRGYKPGNYIVFFICRRDDPNTILATVLRRRFSVSVAMLGDEAAIRWIKQNEDIFKRKPFTDLA